MSCPFLRVAFKKGENLGSGIKCRVLAQNEWTLLDFFKELICDKRFGESLYLTILR